MGLARWTCVKSHSDHKRRRDKRRRGAPDLSKKELREGRWRAVVGGRDCPSRQISVSDMRRDR